MPVSPLASLLPGVGSPTKEETSAWLLMCDPYKADEATCTRRVSSTLPPLAISSNVQVPPPSDSLQTGAPGVELRYVTSLASSMLTLGSIVRDGPWLATC